MIKFNNFTKTLAKMVNLVVGLFSKTSSVMQLKYKLSGLDLDDENKKIKTSVDRDLMQRKSSG